jgi:PAS domain S-box-containing protein
MKPSEQNKSKKAGTPSKSSSMIDKLKRELAAKEHELQKRNEELSVFNEEIQTTNEELRATNEELRVANEELISTGEELKATNARLGNALEELESVSDIPALFLDDKLRIGNFTPAMNRLVKLTKGDMNRPVDQLSDSCVGENMGADAGRVLETGEPLSAEVQCLGQWYLRHMFPRLTPRRTISGVTVSFTDITARKRSEEKLAYQSFMLANVHEPVIGLDADFVINYWNKSAWALYGWTAEEAIGKPSVELFQSEFVDATMEKNAARLRNAGRGVFEAFHRTKDGRQVFVEVHSAMIPDERGNPTGYISTCRDLTGRKKAEEALRQSEARLRSVLDNSIDVIYRLNVQTGRYEYASPSAEAVVGYSPEELMAQDAEAAMEIIHPDDRRTFRAALGRLEDVGRTEVEYRLRTKSGDYRWLSNRMSLLRDSQGKSLNRNGNIRDVTELKLAEEALRLSEIRYRFLFNSLIEGFCIVEMVFDDSGKPVDYRFLEVNETFEEQTGLHDAEGKLMRDLAPDHEDFWFQIYGNIALTGKPARFVNEAKALNRWFDVNSFRFGGEQSRKVAICFSDITQRMLMEEQLQITLKRFYLILSEMQFGILLVTDDNRVEFVNQAYCAIFDLEDSPADLAKLSASEMIEKIRPSYADPDAAMARIREIVGSNQPVKFEDVRMQNGRTCLRDFLPIRLGEKRYGRLWIHKDNTERKKAEEALRQSEEKYRLLVEHAPSAIYEIDFPGNRFKSVNDEMCKMLGYTEAELLAMKPNDMLDKESAALFLDRMQKAQAGEAPPEYVEFKGRKKDGTELWCILHTTFKYQDGKIVGAFVVAHDITDRRNAEQQILQASEELRLKNDELTRFNNVMVDRELRMIELKKEVNAFCGRLGQPPAYKVDF